MEEKKSLVEQLRSIDRFDGSCVIATAIGMNCRNYSECFNCRNDAVRILADRIEREYMPRPLFEDGEPVQFGDEVELHYKSGGFEKGIIQEVHVNKGPVYTLSFVGCDHERLFRYDSTCDVLKRPEPYVVDADGVKIAEGDTVYLSPEFHEYAGKGYEKSERKCGLSGVEYGEKLTVLCADDRRVRFTRSAGAWCPPSWLTHKQPDSLERIRYDAAKLANDYWGCSALCFSGCTALIDGKRPYERYKCGNCSDAMTLNLIERTKAVCEREGGKA